MKTNILTRFIGKTKLGFNRKSPEILLGAGLIGFGVTTVLACKATKKCDTILENHKKSMSSIREAKELASTIDVEYTEEDAKKDTVIVYSKTAVAFAKLYAPAIISGILSTSLVIASHVILKNRYKGALSALAVTGSAFAAYKQEVAKRFGKEADYEASHPSDCKVATKKDENGIETESEEVVRGYSGYSRIFDEVNTVEWCKDPTRNLDFIIMQQNYLNELLRARGYVFLNEAYKALGLKPTKAGQIVGWVWDESHGKIDFGVADSENPNVRAFIAGFERSVILDFNVDGPILDVIPLENV